ncbi:hypothetical protein [Vreelandella salicampi]|nr:hypothetical protein [Halomonas salicampi]
MKNGHLANQQSGRFIVFSLSKPFSLIQPNSSGSITELAQL